MQNFSDFVVQSNILQSSPVDKDDLLIPIVAKRIFCESLIEVFMTLLTTTCRVQRYFNSFGLVTKKNTHSLIWYADNKNNLIYL